MTDDMGPLFEALAKAQAEMGAAMKTANNPHFRSKYADLASVRDACFPALNKHGISVIQRVVIDGGERAVETILAHSSGATISDRVPLIIGKNDMQGLGSAITYARRYSLMGMAGIAPEDDDGNAAAKAPPERDMRQPSVVSNHDASKEARAELEHIYETMMAALGDCPAAEITQFPAHWKTTISRLTDEAPDLRDKFGAEYKKARIRAADDATSKGANAA